MEFPFLDQLKPWIKDKFDYRKNNKEQLNLLSPFVMLSSPAIVTNEIKTSDEILKMYSSGNYTKTAYYGCVISNSTNDIDRTYEKSFSTIGRDLDGNTIVVPGEKNRRVSPPVILSLEIDSLNGNNTLKTANLEIKVFTLKQLEMFELFFLRPGMNVVLEYGHNSDIRKPNTPLWAGSLWSGKTTIDKYLFANKNHKEFMNSYFEIYSQKNITTKKDYIGILKETNGDYDFMAGRVTNFSYTIESDGSYNVKLEISAGNELQLWTPIKQGKLKAISTTKKEKISSDYSTWVSKLITDFNFPTTLKDALPKNEWEEDFFNWGVINDDAKDEKYSKTLYISFRLILHILNKLDLFLTKSEVIKTNQYYYLKDEKNPKSEKISIIPINSSRYLISSNDSLLFPGFMPVVDYSETSKLIEINEEAERQDCKIGKTKQYEFNVSNQEEGLFTPELFTIYNEYNDTPREIYKNVGNLLNVFISYDFFIDAYDKAYTKADVVNSLLLLVSANTFGMCNLTIQKPLDIEGTNDLIIVDEKLKIKNPKPQKKEKENIYRLNIGASGSIVENFEFKLELDNLMQAQALYNSRFILNSNKNKTKNNPTFRADFKNIEIVNLRTKYANIDYSYAKSADGYYSLNPILAKEIDEVTDINKQNEENAEAKSKAQTTKEKKDADKLAEKEIQNKRETINKNIVRFKMNPVGKKEGINNLIYKDSSLIQAKIPKQQTGTIGLTFLEATITIDGMVGISCGEYFLMDGVPEIYNQRGYFQVMNVKHSIKENRWTTTLEMAYRFTFE
jgi:hypothetical protein